MVTRRLVILGSTGSIGEQTLDVVEANPKELSVIALATNTKVDRLLEQIERYHPKMVCVGSEEAREKLGPIDKKIPVLVGLDGLMALAAHPEADLVVNALVGGIGLRPTLAALDAGHNVALANKETLVVGGDLVMERARERGVSIHPIDSEHAAISECLKGRRPEEVHRLILTASGGPFRVRPAETFDSITKAEALNHPNWEMGPKITIDSATLMNKGLEVIEAHHLFGVPADKINVVVHPKSIIHSMVELTDGSVIAQLAPPDMRIPIQQAILPAASGPVGKFRAPLNLLTLPPLVFEEVDMNKFPCLRLAFEVLSNGGTMPAVMNAANEIAVAAFLAEQIKFTSIPACVEAVMKTHRVVPVPSLSDLLEADREGRERARKHLGLECSQ